MNTWESSTRRAPAWLFLVLMAAIAAGGMLVNLWFFPSGLWQKLMHASGGFVVPTLQGGVLQLFLQVVLVLLLLGRFRPAELGLRLAAVPAGIALTALVWAGMQAGALLTCVVVGADIQLHPAWGGGGALVLTGELCGQLLGNALVEETVFRGFLVIQFLLIARAWRADRPRLAACLAVLAAAAVFAVSHVPNRVMKEAYGSPGAVLADQGRLLFFACLYGWLYLRTRNLPFLIGIHSLGNRPTMLIGSPEVALEPNVVSQILGVTVGVLAFRKRDGPDGAAQDQDAGSNSAQTAPAGSWITQ